MKTFSLVLVAFPLWRFNPIRTGGEGAYMPSPATYLRISLQIHVRAQCAFYHIKLSRFAEKNEARTKYQNFMRGDPNKLGRRKIRKVNHWGGGSISAPPMYFGFGFLEMICLVVIHYFQKD